MRLLWIDDRPADTELEALAQDMGIDLVSELNAKAGLERLDRDYKGIDGVILDAMGLLDERPDQQADNMQALNRCLSGLRERDKRFGELKPHCIWTAEEEEARKHCDPSVKIFSKDAGGMGMLLYMQEVIGDQPRYRVRRKHADVLAILRRIGQGDERLGEYENSLLEILLALDQGRTDLVPEQYYNTLRKLIELMLKDANRAGLLHDACVNNAGRKGLNLTESIRFLAGVPVPLFEVRCAKAHLSETRRKDIEFILDKTNQHSHTQEQIGSSRMTLASPAESGGLTGLYSVLFMVFSQLQWYAGYVQQHNDVAANKRYWEDLKRELVIGVISEITEKHAKLKPDSGGKKIHVYRTMVDEHHLVIGTRVKASVSHGELGPVAKSISLLGPE